MTVAVALQGAGPVVLGVRVSDVSPAELETGNDTAAATVDLVEFQLASDRVVVPNLDGASGRSTTTTSTPRSAPPPG